MHISSCTHIGCLDVHCSELSCALLASIDWSWLSRVVAASHCFPPQSFVDRGIECVCGSGDSCILLESDSLATVAIGRVLCSVYNFWPAFICLFSAVVCVRCATCVMDHFLQTAPLFLHSYSKTLWLPGLAGLPHPQAWSCSPHLPAEAHQVRGWSCSPHPQALWRRHTRDQVITVASKALICGKNSSRPNFQEGMGVGILTLLLLLISSTLTYCNIYWNFIARRSLLFWELIKLRSVPPKHFNSLTRPPILPNSSPRPVEIVLSSSWQGCKQFVLEITQYWCYVDFMMTLEHELLSHQIWRCMC